MYIALGTQQNPQRRAMYLAKNGASLFCKVDGVNDIFFRVVTNKSLSDQQSYDLINDLLSHLAQTQDIRDASFQKIYSTYFLPHPGALIALWEAASTGRPKTTRLLLELGLYSRINDLKDDHGSPLTVFDNTLKWAEYSRQAHMEMLAAYKPGAARSRALASKAVYDPKQGGRERAAEAYLGLPEVLWLLRSHGAKRAYELQRLSDHAVFDTVWDMNDMDLHGFTPETQPNREIWNAVYDLARYPADWPEQVTEELQKRYPEVKVLGDPAK